MVLEMFHGRVATDMTRVVWTAAVLDRWKEMEKLPHYRLSSVVYFQKTETNARCFLRRQDNPEVNYRATRMFRDSGGMFIEKIPHSATQQQARCWWRRWLRHCATSRKVAGSIPVGVIAIFHCHNPSGRTMALGLTQPLTEMSTRIRTRNPSKRAAAKPRQRPRGHWDRPWFHFFVYFWGQGTACFGVGAGEVVQFIEERPKCPDMFSCWFKSNFSVFMASDWLDMYLGSCLGTDVFRITTISAVSIFLPVYKRRLLLPRQSLRNFITSEGEGPVLYLRC